MADPSTKGLIEDLAACIHGAGVGVDAPVALAAVGVGDFIEEASAVVAVAHGKAIGVLGGVDTTLGIVAGGHGVVLAADEFGVVDGATQGVVTGNLKVAIFPKGDMGFA